MAAFKHLRHAHLRLAGAMLAAAMIGVVPVGAQSAKMARVDIELVLAVDISQSMDYDEHELQKNGYVDAFRHADVVRAITSGPEGKIAVTYMEWAGYDPYVVIPWTIIDGPKAANDFANRLAKEPIQSEQRTSISNALLGAAELIDGNAIAAHRRVIDVSGDGANNTGMPVEQARDSVLKRKININGLPILLGKPKEFYDIDHLDRYYKDCVIGGEGAFIAPVYDLKQLAATIRKKLVMEIAGLELNNGAAPVQFAEAPAPKEGVMPAQLRLPTSKSDCFAGERAMGGGYYGGYESFRPGRP